jgi:hypothetical protein
MKRDIKSSKRGKRVGGLGFRGRKGRGDIRLVVSQKEGESIISLAFNIAQCPL